MEMEQRIIITVNEYLVYAGHFAKFFIYIISFMFITNLLVGV